MSRSNGPPVEEDESPAASPANSLSSDNHIQDVVGDGSPIRGVGLGATFDEHAIEAEINENNNPNIMPGTRQSESRLVAEKTTPTSSKASPTTTNKQVATTKKSGSKGKQVKKSKASKRNEKEQPQQQGEPADECNTGKKQGEVNTATDSEPAPIMHVPIPADVLARLKISEIKLELSIREVSFGSSWNKAKLLEHLQHALELETPVVHSKKVGIQKKDKCNDEDDLTGFAPGAYWKLLTPMATVVEEPKIAPKLHAPTEDAVVPPQPKHNYKDKFDRPPFVGTVKRPVLSRTGRPMLDANNNPMMEEKVRTEGTANPEFLRKHTLNRHSLPTEFVNPFFPWHEHSVNNNKAFSMALLCEWTNTKAVKLANGGEHYKNYNHNRDYFTPKDIRQMLGLYVLNGIAHSPSLDSKFDKSDLANGNAFVQKNISHTRYKHFKAFFACQDPTLPVPPKKEHGNWFVKPLVDWINYCGPYVWMLGPNASVDEQTIAFKGRSSMKKRITYKRAGDGFQCDALCENGFTYSVFFRNEPSPRKYKRMGFSDLHARTMALFDSIEDAYTRIWMDNLYVSSLFCRGAYQHDKKVLVAGVARKSRGVPKVVIQREEKDPKKALALKGTVKAALLEGDSRCPQLVACSFYDSKPVHFISMVAESIEWLTKERKVFDKDEQIVTAIEFLRLNMTDDYNNNMHEVDIADQLRNNYRIDFWLRFYKFWWAIFVWGLGVQMVNAYVVYKDVMKTEGVPRKDWLTHYQFNKAVALAWIDRDEEDLRARKRRLAREKEIQKKRKHSSQQHQDDNPSNTNNNATPVPKRRSNLSDQSSSSASDQKTAKSPTASDHSLHRNGALRYRLDHSLPHYPVLPSKMAYKSKPRCAIHRWATNRKKERKSNVFCCRSCQVSLCIDCFELFHEDPDLLSKKKQLCDNFMKESDDNTE